MSMYVGHGISDEVWMTGWWLLWWFEYLLESLVGRRREKTTRVKEDEQGEAVGPRVDWGMDCEGGREEGDGGDTIGGARQHWVTRGQVGGEEGEEEGEGEGERETRKQKGKEGKFLLK